MLLRLAQISPRLGDVEFNFRKAKELIQKAADDRADLIVFPELALTGYLLKDLVSLVALSSESSMVRELADLSKRISILIGLVEHGEDHFFYNSALYFEGGALRHCHRKTYLPTYGMFDEGRYLSPGKRVQAFDTRFGRIGVMICEDAWHPITPYILCQDGARLLIVISNSPVRGMTESGGFLSVRNWQLITHYYSLLYSVFTIYVNRVGCEDGISFSGTSEVIDPHGEVLEALPFLEETESTVKIDLDELTKARINSPILRDDNFLMSLNELERIKKNTFSR